MKDEVITFGRRPFLKSHAGGDAMANIRAGIFLILFLFSVQSMSQKAVVALPAMNVIYIGLDNPINIAVEGYTYNQLNITTEGCTLEGVHPATYITASTSSFNGCKVFVSYKKEEKDKIDTFKFRIRSIPKPNSYFGTLESGSAPAAALLAQNTIRAAMPNFVYQGVSFKVASYKWKYISNITNNICADSVNGAAIPNTLKKQLIKSKPGDLLLIDDIIAIDAGGIKKRLAPIEIYIVTRKGTLNEPNVLTTQKTNDTNIYFLNFQPIFDCDQNPLFPNSIIKIYYTQLLDSILVSEIHFSSRIILEKQYYSSGKLKAEYNFESNDTMGKAKLYHENGQLKSLGNIIIKKQNIFEQFWPPQWLNEDYILLHTFIPDNYAPIGKWKGYYKSGQIAMECSLNLFGPEIIEKEDETVFYNSCNTCEKIYSIKSAIKFKTTYFKPQLSGLCKTYDLYGKVISEEKFKD